MFAAIVISTLAAAAPATAALKHEIIMQGLDARHPPLIETYPLERLKIAGVASDRELAGAQKPMWDRDAPRSVAEEAR